MLAAPDDLLLHPEVSEALEAGRPVVALESTLIAHGLPAPLNLEVARSAEQIVRQAGAVPATIAVLDGQARIGLTDEQVERLASTKGVLKASRRDLASALVRKANAATTVSATMFLAHRAGIRVFATGGIGGVHRGSHWDVSADLLELGRLPVLVVCAGAKNILDLPATLEVLETQGVPVLGYQTDTFPAFYLASSGLAVTTRVDSPIEVAALVRTHWHFDGKGVVLARPLPASAGLSAEAFASALEQAEHLAEQAQVRGAALTPFLLARLHEITKGATLQANRALIEANALLAAEVARALTTEE